MEIKLKRMPFSIELAKKITEGKIKGAKIKSHDGFDARIIAFDLKGLYPIAVAIKLEDDTECVCSMTEEGYYYKDTSQHPSNLCLLVPTSYKDYSNFEPQRWQAVLVRKRNNDTWFARVAAGTSNEMGYGVISIPNKEDFYPQCLPISKTTIKLLGTTKSYAELMEE